MVSVHDGERGAALGELARFRQVFYRCLPLRADALFELTDAVLCADGPVTTLVGLSLAAEHRRGHGALYDGLAEGRVEVGRLRRALVGLPVPRDRAGRISLGIDVSNWLRPDAATSPDRLFSPHLRARQGTGADDPGLALLLRGRAGAGPHVVDGDPGHPAAGPV